MTRLRLLADDLTGALDSAARFVPMTGPVAVTWQDVASSGLGRDRQRHPRAARRSGALFASSASRRCWTAGRRHSRRSTACCAAMWRWNSPHACAGSIIVCWRRPSRSRAVSPATAASLRAAATSGAIPASICRPNCARSASRHSMRDAETDADLDAIVAEGRRLTGRVLWCGTGGLAGALAGHGAVPRPFCRCRSWR